ncbi:alpha/beta hydrolase [Streptomyces sp. NPDC000594]|uniref:alpha/beta fold hydrolase n=1 Tax=Streptomyces sp. NPDC000594 TaxID=3154261 RepID=UPI0033281C94
MLRRAGALTGGATATVVAGSGVASAAKGGAPKGSTAGGNTAEGAGNGSPIRVIPVPEQAAARQGSVEVDGARLVYWDTGGDGAPVVLLHPASGSAESWPYQQPFLARAGFRVIGYSRRGAAGSGHGDPERPGTGSGDLLALADALGLGRCHVVGVAAGGGIALDHALRYPERLRSLTLAGSVTGVQEPEYRALLASLRPAAWNSLPAAFRELGPAYRAADPAGVARWVEINRRAVAGRPLTQPHAVRATWAHLAALTVPTLLLWGDGDLYTPPPLQRLLAARLPRVRTQVLDECGHNAHWERSDLFNPALLRFLKRRPTARTSEARTPAG